MAKLHQSDKFNIGIPFETFVVPTHGMDIAWVDIQPGRTGTWASASVEVMWRMGENCQYRSFDPTVVLSAGSPYTSSPVDLTGLPEIGVRVTAAESASKEMFISVATATLGR